MRSIISIIILLITFCSCKNEYNESSIEIQIIKITNDYNKAWEQLNVEQIAKYHSDESFIYYFKGELASRSNDHFRKLFPEILSTTKSWSIKKSSEPLVQVISEYAAIVSFTLETESVEKDGKTTLGAGALTYVWNQINGTWKIIHIHDSPK